MNVDYSGYEGREIIGQGEDSAVKRNEVAIDNNECSD